MKSPEMMGMTHTALSYLVTPLAMQHFSANLNRGIEQQ
jgi:hypothetical protein